MGKYALLLTITVALGTTLLARQALEQDTRTSQADRQKEVLAQQIAQSTFNRGVSELRRDYGAGRTLEIDPIDEKTVEHKEVSFVLTDTDPDGSESVSAMGVLKGSSNADGSVSITAKGYYDDAKYRITGDLVRDLDGFSGIGVEGALSSVNGSGSEYLVSGLDTDPVDQGNDANHGSGDGLDRPAMRLDDSGSADDVKSSLSDDQVVGVNGKGDVVNEPIDVNLNDLSQEIKDNKDTLSASDLENGGSFGSTDDPAIVAVDEDLTLDGDTHGVGALLVSGNFTMRGNAQWEGVILVQSGDTHVKDTDDFTGNARVFGSLMMQTGGSGGLDLRGSTRIQYSSAALAVLSDVLPTMEKSVTFRVTNRSTKMFNSGS